MDYSGDRAMYTRSASGITVLAHLFGVTAVILLLIWLLHYREGIYLDSHNASRIFNVHPFLMFSGFIFVAGEAMMAYKTVVGTHEVKKFVHMLLNLIAICLGIIGLHAVFKFHDRQNLGDMYSLHSWMGMGTFCLFILQWLFGLSLFLFPKASVATRARALPWHICGGRAMLYMAICMAASVDVIMIPLNSSQHDKRRWHPCFDPLLRSPRSFVDLTEFYPQKSFDRDVEQEEAAKLIVFPLTVAAHIYCKLYRIEFDSCRSSTIENVELFQFWCK